MSIFFLPILVSSGLLHRSISATPNLVRLFLSEDAPYQSGLAAQENLQAKASYLLHATGTGTDDSLPPGFEDPDAAYELRAASQIPVVKWKCPHKILLNPEWRVVAGEESEEIALQNYRQLRVLEAIYPRQFNIPPNPSDSTEIQDATYDDSKIPLIPIMAIEDEDSSPEQVTTTAPVTSLSQGYHQPGVPSIPMMNVVTDSVLSTKEQSQPPAAQAYLSLPPALSGHSLIAEPDVMAAASAAFTAIMSSSEEGSMIDRDLLINILKDPTLLRMVSDHGVGAPQQATQQTPPAIVPSSAAPIPQPSFPQVHPQTNISNHHPHFSEIRPSQVHPMTGLMPPLAVASHAVSVNVPAKPVTDASSARDINYYKSLVQQHGGDNPGGLDIPASMGNYPRNFVGVNLPGFNSKQQRDGKLQRIPKPCIYFNTPRGCRRGESCLYQHDMVQQTDQRNGPKRIKLDRGMADRN